MYIVKTPHIIKTLFSDFIWNIETYNPEVYLTFDDGPIPEITPWVLNQLDKFDFKATFFCVGENVKTNPHILQEIIDRGHKIGNHTFHHLNGWHHDVDDYIEDIKLADLYISSDLFRPPYGKLKPSQSSIIKQNKTIVMWDIISGDFDSNLSPEKCASNVINNIQPGSVIVFHDSVKAFKNLKYALPLCLQYLSDIGYVSKSLTVNNTYLQHV